MSEAECGSRRGVKPGEDEAEPGQQRALLDHEARVTGRGWAGRTHVDGAAQQGAALQRLEDDLVEVAGCLAQLIPLGDAPCEVLKALGGAAPRQGFIAAVHPVDGPRSALQRHAGRGIRGRPAAVPWAPTHLA